VIDFFGLKRGGLVKGPPLVVAYCLLALVAGCVSAPGAPTSTKAMAAFADVKLPNDRPNIILITAEDLSPRIGAFGDKLAHTPNIDALARESVLFERAYATAGVCAPSRSALITGVHQQSLGTMHMRTSSFGQSMDHGHPYEAVPPPEVKAFPELLRAAGYYAINRSKTDYQFGNPFTVWDENGRTVDWNNRAPGQPLFAMLNFEQTHESYGFTPPVDGANPGFKSISERNRVFDATKTIHTDPGAVEVPPYYPDTPKVRASLARHYDNIAAMDALVGELIAKLKADGLYENSIIIFTTDHGDGLPRAKRTVYESGTHVPLMIRFPHAQDAGRMTKELVSFVDIAPTILAFAGVDAPSWMQGRVIAGPDAAAPPAFVFHAADRLDEREQRVKAVGSDRYRYIRHYTPDRPRLPDISFQNGGGVMQEMRRLFAAQELPPQIAAYFETPGPAEELYDVAADPHEVRNLASDPAYASVLGELRRAMDSWIERVGDLSAVDENDMVKRMWPAGVQPRTMEPIACRNPENAIVLASATQGASIGYRVNEGAWRLYTTPIKADALLETKAIRYGYAESGVEIIDTKAMSVCQ
jgi:arylsulfatase A-like enzyme